MLQYFASISQVDSLRILLHCDCNIQLVDDGNNTVLHYASYTGECEVVILLLHHGVDINAKNDYGDSVLHIAVKTNNEEMQAKGRRSSKLCYRLRCCQIDENEFQRLFGKSDATEDERIWLSDQPDGVEVDLYESG